MFYQNYPTIIFAMTRRTSWVPRRGYPGILGGGGRGASCSRGDSKNLVKCYGHVPGSGLRWVPERLSLRGRTHPDTDDSSGRDDSWAYVVNFSEIILLIYYGCECLIARSMTSFVFGASRKST